MIDPLQMPTLGTLRIPHEFWWARVEPVPLAAMPYPSQFVWEAAADAGFRDVVNLTAESPSYDPSPLACHCVALQDLYGNQVPSDHARESLAVARAVSIVVDCLNDGRGVIVHCAGGTGRSGTVIGGALVSLGEDPSFVVEWLHIVHRSRGREGWPESRWQRDVLDDFADRSA